MARKKMTHEEWLAEGKRRFGPHMQRWQFVCPACGHVASVQDWQDAGAPETAVAFSCVGRWVKPDLLKPVREAFGGEGPGPCNYAGGGLFAINPVEVHREDKTHRVFDFSEPEDVPI
jgi:hypothetical protein